MLYTWSLYEYFVVRIFYKKLSLLRECTQNHLSTSISICSTSILNLYCLNHSYLKLQTILLNFIFRLRQERDIFYAYSSFVYSSLVNSSLAYSSLTSQSGSSELQHKQSQSARHWQRIMSVQSRCWNKSKSPALQYSVLCTLLTISDVGNSC